MRMTLAAAALVFATAPAFAQGTAPSSAAPAGSPPAQSAPGSQTPAASMNTTPQTTTTPSPSAVQTHNTDSRTAAAPVPGRNSFTQGEARRRITAAGFTDVKGLKKDGQGIWRGQAMKSGSSVGVALDYQGNVVAQ
jgi:hypothetical protein